LYKLETHFHTAISSPCATVDAKDGIDTYKAMGCYNGIVVTDHFSEACFWEKRFTPLAEGSFTSPSWIP
jgi:hypothetical protein